MKNKSELKIKYETLLNMIRKEVGVKDLQFRLTDETKPPPAFAHLTIFDNDYKRGLAILEFTTTESTIEKMLMLNKKLQNLLLFTVKDTTKPPPDVSFTGTEKTKTEFIILDIKCDWSCFNGVYHYRAVFDCLMKTKRKKSK